MPRAEVFLPIEPQARQPALVRRQQRCRPAGRCNACGKNFPVFHPIPPCYLACYLACFSAYSPSFPESHPPPRPRGTSWPRCNRGESGGGTFQTAGGSMRPMVVDHPQPPPNGKVVVAENIRPLQAEQQDHLRRPNANAASGCSAARMASPSGHAGRQPPGQTRRPWTSRCKVRQIRRLAKCHAQRLELGLPQRQGPSPRSQRRACYLHAAARSSPAPSLRSAGR